MSSLRPKPPHTQEELDKLYPKDLQLHQVQVLLRHGERTPVGPRFENTGLTPYWPYCSAARQLVSMTTNIAEGTWTPLKWKRQLEIFGELDDSPETARASNNVGNMCMPGELTDKGRETTFALGERLRRLYVDQLKFMPSQIQNTEDIYMRSTPIPRALDSLQQAFMGMFPEARDSSFPAVSINTRTPWDEQLYPGEDICPRFVQLSRAFAQRAADRYNDSSEMDYVNKLISKYMPQSSKRFAVDSHPRLSGVMDTINSTLAHGSETKLPKEFYDKRGIEIIERVGVEEWFGGFTESQEYRALGIGSALGDVVGRMVDTVDGRKCDSIKTVKLGLSGCHDTTLAAMLSSLGAFGGERWPPYTSHIAFELFSSKVTATNANNQSPWFGGYLGSLWTSQPHRIGRRTMTELSEAEKAQLHGFYVRLRYNDSDVIVPGCRAAGKHLEGDESFCTLAEFKKIVDKFTPKHYKKACISNLDKPAFPPMVEPAGY